MGENREASIHRTEERILLLEGVVGARIVPGLEGDEVHVMAVGPLDQDDIKRLKKDIETIYLLSMGERVDYRKVSIAQISDKVEQSRERRPARPFLKQLTLEFGQKNVVQSHVTIEHQGECYTGSASGNGVETPIEEIVRSACVQALEGLLGFKYKLQVECEINPDRVVAEVTMVSRSNGDRRQYLGASYRKDDLNSSVIKAILQALNRQLEQIKDLE